MRLVLLVVLTSSTAALADPVLQEYDTTRRLVPASQMSFGACDLDVQFRGAIIDAELHQRIHNAGPAKLGTSYEVALPGQAHVLGFALRDRATTVAVSVPVGPPAETVDSDAVLGADPAIVMQLDPDDRGRMVYRAIVQPFAPDRDVTLALHFTDVAEIREGTLHYTLPGGLGPMSCTVRVVTAPGPGAKVQAVRAGGKSLGPAAMFLLGADDVTIEVELAIGSTQPIAWLQTAELGEGFTARAITVIAPPQREAGPRHVVLVIDTSRSMELVGRPVIRSLVRTIVAALPKDAEVEAILYDRTAARVLGSWKRAEDAATVAAIDKALELRPAVNGSDLAGALEVAHTLVTAHQRTTVVAITDGVFGGIPDGALTLALAANIEDVDVHAIVVDPAHMHSPGIGALRAPVAHFGGAYVEVSVDALDTAVLGVASWLRPSWLDLGIAGDSFIAMPDQVRAGGGFVATEITRKPGAVQIRGRADGPISFGARPGPSVPIAQLALANAGAMDFGDGDAGQLARARLRARHAGVDGDHDLAVLSTVGRVAQNRRQMIAGGGPYTRVVALSDAAYEPTVHIGVASSGTRSAIDREIVKRLLNDQLQPHAYSCYQRALGLAPDLGGGVKFVLDLGRGEVTHVDLVGTGNTAFDACLVDAAYNLMPPLPTPGINDDDRTIVNYTLTFAVRENKPLVLPGDADSSSPLDIEAIKGGVPRHLSVDTRTPLGGLTPP